MGSISKRKRARIYKRDGNKCLWCGTTENLTLDHIKPKKFGGTDAYDNLQTLCETCNNVKGHETTDYRSAENRNRWFIGSSPRLVQKLHIIRNQLGDGTS